MTQSTHISLWQHLVPCWRYRCHDYDHMDSLILSYNNTVLRDEDTDTIVCCVSNIRDDSNINIDTCSSAATTSPLGGRPTRCLHHTEISYMMIYAPCADVYFWYRRSCHCHIIYSTHEESSLKKTIPPIVQKYYKNNSFTVLMSFSATIRIACICHFQKNLKKLHSTSDKVPEL